MKRRTFLIGLGGGLALAWWLKPGDRGAPHAPYFQTLNDLFRAQGPGRPVLLIDRQRLAANCRRLTALLPPGRDYRIVAKSLPSVPLIREVMALTGTRRVMVFHQPFITALAAAEPGCDLLLGKPMPVNAAARFYEELPADTGFDPDQQLQWLIDSEARLREYLTLARRLRRRLLVNIELDVGLHRGGLTEPAQLDALLTLIEAHPDRLGFSGFMGYDAHVGKLPAVVESREDSLRKSQAVYQGFIDRLYRLQPKYREQRLTFNGAGSPTVALHGDETPLNELAAGSALVKPTDFDLDTLADFEPAAFIAAPVLKAMDGLHLPGPLPLGDAWALWDPNRARTYFIYGGYWKAEPVSPAGIAANSLYGVSTNQMMYNGADSTALEVNDQIFFRPTQSEFVLLQFGDLAAVSDGTLQDWWPPLPQGEGA
ncbi:MAG: alanine racemase [Alcanivorax sp.]|uniref:Alanine racemase n=1 Tax=Alloalcanivorax marinus TaxID=1177169 RepID=A0A9Q3YPE8_9GAMM|nr:alanine racemase [Alloalcanivorax marinus]MCC4309751.1 alanine racemase [Alloalcanivorax marinus]